MRRSCVKPTPYTAAKVDAVPFDSVPGSGFETSAMAAAIVPPRCRSTGSGAHLSIDPARDQRLSRHQRRLEGEWNGQPRRRSLRDQRPE